MAVATAAAAADKEKKAKPEVAPDAVIQAAYEKAGKAIDTIITNFEGLRRTLNEEASAISEAAELRRRARDVEDYDNMMARQAIVDEQAREDKARNERFIREDRERSEAHDKRMSLLREAEDELYNLINLKRDASLTPKTVRETFTSFVQKKEQDAEGKGKGKAESEYKTAKALDDSKRETEFALLKQKNEQLESSNRDLLKEVAELRATYNSTLTHMKDVSTVALNASAGIKAKADDTVNTAVQASGGKGLR